MNNSWPKPLPEDRYNHEMGRFNAEIRDAEKKIEIINAATGQKLVDLTSGFNERGEGIFTIEECKAKAVDEQTCCANFYRSELADVQEKYIPYCPI